MKEILSKLLQGKTLTRPEVRATFARIMAGEMEPAQVASLLTLMATHTPTSEELIGVAEVMRENVLPIPVGDKADQVIDTCGTGGVGSNIFNVSTTAALVAAACGVPVAKHGNRSVTSRSGSSDVLQLLGVKLDAAPAVEARCLAEANICFAFAPQHHPAMKHVGPVRQALGFATIFNLVGPLTNPAGAKRQMVGVRSVELADLIVQVLVELGARRALVVHGSDETVPHAAGLCELSILGSTYLARFDGRDISHITIRPEDLGLSRGTLGEIHVDSPEASVRIVQGVLAGEKGSARDMVLLNAAGALWVGGKIDELGAGIGMAAEAIDSGRAAETLAKLVTLSHQSS